MSTEGHDWEDILPCAVYAYNTSTHAVTGFSPMELMFLRPSTCLQLRVDPSGYDVDDYYAVAQRRATSNLREVTKRLQQAAYKQKLSFDAANRLAQPLSPGTPVYVKCEVRDKLQPKWRPGWTVIQQYDSGIVRLRHDTGIEKVLHLTKVRPLCPRPAPMSSLAIMHVASDPLHRPPDASTSRPQRHRRPPIWLSDYVPS
ncbi:hypothetical protein M513_05858 [Trichuris suis]|uniref:Integrase catalytic domain-containing protein n=1 Tax=Trichuris suis TaxID=68888 RepID=A0A085M831_9BILA|nr:hypothetical protein M513_05858 [Trichuris suis]